MVRRKQQLCRTALSGKLFATTFAALILLCTATASVQKAPDKSQVEHGRYLVQQVGLCGDCHTPRDDHGQSIESKALRGAGIGFKPLAEMPWGGYAPPIAGLPGFTDAQAITFLTTGKDPTGNHPKPPMPPYRFNRRDAAAVVAYLRRNWRARRSNKLIDRECPESSSLASFMDSRGRLSPHFPPPASEFRRTNPVHRCSDRPA